MRLVAWRWFWKAVAIIVLFFVLPIHIIRSEELPKPAAVKPPKPDLVFRAQGGAVHRLHHRPCTDKAVLEHINPEYHDKVQAATLTWTDGKDWSSCWVEEDGRVFSLDSAGQPFGMNEFQPFILKSLYKDESL